MFGNSTSASTSTSTSGGLFGSKENAAKDSSKPEEGQAKVDTTSKAAVKEETKPSNSKETETASDKKPAFSLGKKEPETGTEAKISAESVKTEDKTNLKTGNLELKNASSVPTAPGEYLKNKSFEDIISKWTSTLTDSVKRFNAEAQETAKFDQILVQNGAKIARTYHEVLAAEVAQTRIDDVLSYVSRQQDDIDAMLTQLESQASSSKHALQPVDKERLDAYTLAGQMNDKLDSLEGSLGSLIGEINTLTKEVHHVRDSDPISQIVQVLNSHLASLQFIDESANSLRTKLEQSKP